MKNVFKMSLNGELNLFLGFQVKKLKDRIFLSQAIYVKKLAKKFGKSMTDSLIYLTTGWPNITYKSLCKISRGSTIILVGNKFGIWYSCDTTTK